MYALVRIIQALILPPSSLLLLMLAGLLLLRKRPVVGRMLLSVGLLLLYLLSLPLVADMLVRPLESYAPPLNPMTVKADAVVVLGSGVQDRSWVPAPAAPSELTTTRVIAGVELAKRLRIPLLLSGGSGEIAPVSVREATAMADLAVQLGVPQEWMRINDVSRNTYEDAATVQVLIKGRGIILVTSAFHMQRATALFRRRGFTVIPAPVAYRAQTRPLSLGYLLPHATHLETSALSLSEYVSTVWYRVRGLI